VVGAGIIGLADATFPSLNLESLQTAVVVLTLVGFPIALVLAWAYEVRPEEPRKVEEATEGTSELLVPGDRKSIVVLPFDNMSPDPGDGYFADGLTEEIITNLSYLKTLRVISRSSAMVLKGTQKDVRTIGRELDVGYVLEGSVRKVGNDLRITAQLIDARTDAHLWAERYDGVLDDVFDMQDRVSASIVDALQLTFTPDEEKRVGGRRIENVQAYQCYLRARQETWLFTPDGLERATGYLRNAYEIIGDNALLHSGMAYVCWQYVNMGLEHEEYIDKAEDFAHKALQLDPESAEAHLVLGLLYQAFRGDQQRSIRHFKRALSVNPDDAHALLWICVGYSIVGRMHAVGPLWERLKRVDPLTPMDNFDVFQDIFAGRFDQDQDYAKWLRAEPENPAALLFCAWFLALCGRHAEAREVVERYANDEWHDTFTVGARLLALAIDGNISGMATTLTDDIERTTKRDPQFSHFMADTYGLAGLRDEALDWLENALSRGWANYPFTVQHDPLLVPLRDEPKFLEIADRMKREWENFEV
jgi:TolB-like protein